MMITDGLTGDLFVERGQGYYVKVLTKSLFLVMLMMVHQEHLLIIQPFRWLLTSGQNFSG